MGAESWYAVEGYDGASGETMEPPPLHRTGVPPAPNPHANEATPTRSFSKLGLSPHPRACLPSHLSHIRHLPKILNRRESRRCGRTSPMITSETGSRRLMWRGLEARVELSGPAPVENGCFHETGCRGHLPGHEGLHLRHLVPCTARPITPTHPSKHVAPTGATLPCPDSRIHALTGC